VQQDIDLNISVEARLGLFFLVLGCILVLINSLANHITPTAIAPVEHPNIVSSKEIFRGDTSKKQVIFTFDGGSGADSADQILSILSKHRINGTFFLTGQFVHSYPDLVRKMAKEGNEIFNHTFNHPHLTELDNGQIAMELRRMNISLEIAVGTSSKPYFRPPYGDRDDRVLEAAAREGYWSVYWTIDAGDWEESTGMTAEAVKERILSSLAPGNIYLMHLGNKITGNILDEIFSTIESRGYRIVSLTEGI